jgi:hypothetical protein
VDNLTNEEKLQMLRSMMDDDSDSDMVLSTYLKLAARKIINRAYPYREDVTEIPTKYEMLQIEIALYLLNKRGAEGQTYHVEDGITRTYENADIPSSFLSQISPQVGVIR